MGCSYKMILLFFLGEMGETTEDTIARVFCWSIVVAFISLDFLIVAHRGWSDNCSRFRPKGKIAWIPVVCTLLLTGSWIFTLCIPSLFPGLHGLPMLGMCVVSLQVGVRTVGLRYFPVSKEAMEAAIQGDLMSDFDDSRHWPNMTLPQIEE